MNTFYLPPGGIPEWQDIITQAHNQKRNSVTRDVNRVPPAVSRQTEGPIPFAKQLEDKLKPMQQSRRYL